MRTRSLVAAIAVMALGPVASSAPQSPAPRPSPKPSASRPPAAAPARAGAGPSLPSRVPAKPATVIEQVVAVVSAGTPTDPAEQVSRKLLLAEVARVTGGSAKAKALLEAVVPVIDAMPKVDPSDKEGKRINFVRSTRREAWIKAMARLDPPLALRSTLNHGDETNATYHASLFESLLDGLQCSAPEVKAAVDDNVQRLLADVKRSLEARSWGLANAPTALRVAGRASRLCGLDTRGDEVRTLADHVLPVFESTNLIIRACEMADAKASVALPAERAKAITSFARYRLKDLDIGGRDSCVTTKLIFAARMAPDVGVDDSARGPLADLVTAMVGELGPEELRFGSCLDAQELAELTAVNPAAAARGIGLAIEGWRKQDRLQSYCRLPSAAASAGRRLADAGAAPPWMCSALTVRPEGKSLTAEEEKTLRREQTLAAVELRGRCPEAEPLLQVDRSDLDLLTSVRRRQLASDRAAAEPMVADDLKALPAADRYAYAVAVLPAFWTKE